jgi:hypothetical protein
VAADQAAVSFLVDPLASCQINQLRLLQVRHYAKVILIIVFLHRERRFLEPGDHRIHRSRCKLLYCQTMQELGKVLVGWGGVACQGCDFTAQSSGLETGTPPDVACRLKGYHCVFELAAHQHLHHWRGAFTIRGSLKNNLSTGYGIRSCSRLLKVYSNGGLITLEADS